ncbi:MAG TPA: TIGR02281 family clan AA aspartic protease [Sphingomicrobium sp.]|nr:TIGR02281 family clan AA aspartic protease [Sphingomicrobium sp.]
MSEFDTPRAFYLAILIIFVASSLIGMRLPIAKVAKMLLGWAAIFGLFFIIFAFRGEFVSLGQRLRAEATGTPVQRGAEVRIPMAEDGHFWVEGTVNGRATRFLVDSGASVTTIGAGAAREAGVEGRDRGYISTANGRAEVSRGYAGRLQVASIERTDFPVLINANDDTNVLGMNFLSSLAGWRVDGTYLVLRP